MSDKDATAAIIDRLMVINYDKICAVELALLDRKRRVDFWTLEPRQTPSPGFRATAYEIKVSRSDFLRDSADKQSLALQFCDRFFYATPPGLIDRSEVPDFAGLIEIGPKRCTFVKKAPKREKQEPTWDFLVGLMRNSTQVRRDTSLLRTELAQLRHHLDMREQADKHRRDREWARWTRQSTNDGANK